MYSVVVLMALSTSAESPDFGKRGCRGCCGGYSCSGYTSSYGCCGGRSYGYGGCCGGSVYYGGGCSGTAMRGMGMAYAPGGTVREMPYSEGPIVRESAYGNPGNFSSETGNGNGNGNGYALGGPAEVAVMLPAPGRLMIDDYPVPSISDRHVYVTAPLAPNETRQVTFTTQVMKDGKPLTVTKLVTLKPGERTQVAITAP